MEVGSCGVVSVIAVPTLWMYGGYMGTIVKVLRKRQITLPKEICDALGIEEGDLLVLEVVDGKIVARKLDPVDALRGFLKPEHVPRELAEVLDVERRESER